MIETVVGILGGASVAVFGWAIHAGNRISIVETKQDNHEKLIGVKFDAIINRFDEINRRLTRIEENMNERRYKPLELEGISNVKN